MDSPCGEAALAANQLIAQSISDAVPLRALKDAIFAAPGSPSARFCFGLPCAAVSPRIRPPYGTGTGTWKPENRAAARFFLTFQPMERGSSVFASSLWVGSGRLAALPPAVRVWTLVIQAPRIIVA
jgi:hypothetical protein